MVDTEMPLVDRNLFIWMKESSRFVSLSSISNTPAPAENLPIRGLFRKCMNIFVDSYA